MVVMSHHFLGDSSVDAVAQINTESRLNIGDRAGSDVMVYSKSPDGTVGTHVKQQLVAFRRVFVPAESTTLLLIVLSSGAHTIVVET
ncbi:unnamed protein product [Dovyalis caffra]|uniref:Uncharacterized protein n=1 Tax=Dovyalis caffra TaxID=77055 RepID=A0AAV1R6H6_9ROSI|nr:unnamed protein product [Dovyalis caffra]